MKRYPSRFVFLVLLCLGWQQVPGAATKIQTMERIVSEHVGVLIASERQWLGRDTIVSLERCWEFIQGTIDGKLPKFVVIRVEWNEVGSSIDPDGGGIRVGMERGAVGKDPKGYLVHTAARELARMALVRLTQSAAAKLENRFVIDGMSEILAREFTQTTKALQGAWVLSEYARRLRGLSLSGEVEGRSGSTRLATAQGITLLLTCREAYGRERVLKFFDSLKKSPLAGALASAFRSPPAVVEEVWREKVRSKALAALSASGQGAPALREARLQPANPRPGERLEVQLFFDPAGNRLAAENVFAVDEASGQVIQGESPESAAAGYVRILVPIAPGRAPGRYTLRVDAVDDEGNVGQSTCDYEIHP